MRAGETRGEDDIGQAEKRWGQAEKRWGQAEKRRDQAYNRPARPRPESGVSRAHPLDRTMSQGQDPLIRQLQTAATRKKLPKSKIG